MKTFCKIVENNRELKEAYLVRKKVFVIEQNVPESLEWDKYDDTALHVICKVDESIVGTGRIVFLNDAAKIGRVAVLKSYRNQGIGKMIIQFLIEESKKREKKTIFANVQIRAQKFYEKLGFKRVGNTFIEAGIEHIKMILSQ